MALKVDYIRDETAFDALRPEWDALHSVSGAQIFQTHTWLRTWWEVYGRARRDQRLHIMTVRSDGALVAVLPLYFEKLGIPFLGLTRLRMIGVYETYGEYSIIADPRAGREPFRELAAELAGIIKGPGCDMVAFFRYPPDSAPMNALIEELKGRRLLGRTVPNVITRVVMDLPASWASYVASLSANERELIGRKTRAVERHGAAFEVILRPDPAAFGDYVRLHMASWETRGVAGYFASPLFREFLERVTARCMATGSSRLYFLAKDGVRFAAVHTFTVNGQCCFYLSGLDRQHALAGLSPGTVLLARAIRDAIESKDTFFDFQGGEEEYKFRLGGRKTYFSKTQFFPRDHQGLKVMAFIKTQEIYHGLHWQITGRMWPGLRSTFRTAL
jgi:CelD/BcsL family acetyltransferase involved in cellulose biosynthesis